MVSYILNLVFMSQRYRISEAKEKNVLVGLASFFFCEYLSSCQSVCLFWIRIQKETSTV